VLPQRRSTSAAGPWHDFRAAVLHLLGIDHESLTFFHNGIRRWPNNVYWEGVRELLA
jgi:hypothetical protein